ncbi:MAG: cohesin domain-containing protein [Methanomicrobiales archaeon]|nr:cohesin domain-containing protein [Methanomicrobiales archaeon]
MKKIDLSKIILALFISVLLFESASALTVKAGDARGAQGSTVKLAVIMEGASNVGSVDLVLSYDQNIVQAIGVDRGGIASNAYMESNTAIPGQVRIGLADSSGISGTGDLILVSFLLTGGAGARTPVTIQQDAVHTVELAEVSVSTSNGSIIISEGPPITRAGGVLSAILLSFGIAIAVLLFFRRGREVR